MIRPAGFGSNPDTLKSNAFQSESMDDIGKIALQAQREFDSMHLKLLENDFDLLILAEPEDEPLPDSVFPNNWFSTHEEKGLVLYPMLSEFRRRERREGFIEQIQKTGAYNEVLDLSEYENKGKFLEGTGSIVFDHIEKTAYCALSPRSDEELFEKLCIKLGYRSCSFHAKDRNGIPIYHTNVLMAIGEKSAVICTEIIHEEEKVLNLLSKKEIVDISEEQMTQFCGNTLLASNTKGERFWLMSKTAEESFTFAQKASLEKDGFILSFQIPTIEKYGGGSVRCMLAELY
jgi:hypothetical protein